MVVTCTAPADGRISAWETAETVTVTPGTTAPLLSMTLPDRRPSAKPCGSATGAGFDAGVFFTATGETIGAGAASTGATIGGTIPSTGIASFSSAEARMFANGK